MNTIKFIAAVILMLLCTLLSAQTYKDGKLYINEDGSHYFKITLLNQAWIRYQNYNPGSTIYGQPKDNGIDLGIRRFRVQLMSQLTKRVFLYTQIGENNFNNLSDRKLGFFVHDAYGEYAAIPTYVYLGTGLSGWSGLSRFSSPSVGSVMGVDAPLFLQSTNDATDQFLRKLSVYAKGKLGKLDYRVACAQPLAIQKSTLYNPVISPNANFSPKPPKMQTNVYLTYQFKEQESNLIPYNVGTYLGKKKVFNVGTGIVYQPQAMWYTKNTMDTVAHHLLQLAADVFYDAPIKDAGSAVSIYATYAYLDFGTNYIRNLGAMNPANGNNQPRILNGGGNACPLIGTGNVAYAQVGYKFKDSLLGKATLMPYISLEYANFKRLRQGMYYYDAGISWLLNGHNAKLTTAYQSWPVFNTEGVSVQRKSAFVIQYQVSLN